MKKILLFVSCFLFALTSCEIDNYEGPDASIHGSILDEQTGELVGSDMENGNAIKVRSMDLLMLRIKPGISQIPENIVTIWFLLPLMMSVLKMGIFIHLK